MPRRFIDSKLLFPLLAILASALLSIAGYVVNLKAQELKAVQADVAHDHDRLILLESNYSHIKESLDRIDANVNRLTESREKK